MNKPFCEEKECLEFDCEHYENNGQSYGYCWLNGYPTNEIEFVGKDNEENKQ